MSRVRIGYVIACFGILITTGGCAESATAPEAANVQASLTRGRKPVPADTMAVAPTNNGGEDSYTTLSSGHIAGGGRMEP